MDKGSVHQGPRSVARLQTQYSRPVLIHGPIHASGLNQIEISFSMVQRKVLMPYGFASVAAVAERLLPFEQHYEMLATPFEWAFNRRDLMSLMQKLATHETAALQSAA